MNQTIKQLRQERLHNQEVVAFSKQNTQLIEGISKLDATTIQAFTALIEFMRGHTTKTEVVNQLEKIETPDTAKAVRQAMASINNMHATLKSKDVDLSPVADKLEALINEVKTLPKDLPEQKDEIAVSNLSELFDKFDSLEDAVADVAKIKLPTPQVNVEKQDIPAPVVNVDAPDFTTLEKQTKEVVKAVKGIVFPDIPETDLTKVEKELKTANKHLKELTEKPMGGSGSAGHTTPYQDSTGKPVYVQPSMDLQVDDTGTYTYLGNATPGTATSEAMWRIKRVTNATGVITHADGTSEFTKQWSQRATYTY